MQSILSCSSKQMVVDHRIRHWLTFASVCSAQEDMGGKRPVIVTEQDAHVGSQIIVSATQNGEQRYSLEYECLVVASWDFATNLLAVLSQDKCALSSVILIGRVLTRSIGASRCFG